MIHLSRPFLDRSSASLELGYLAQRQRFIRMILIWEGRGKDPRPALALWVYLLNESVYVTDGVGSVEAGWQSGSVAELKA